MLPFLFSYLYLPVVTYSDDTLIDSCEEQDLNYGEEEVKSKATTKKADGQA